MSLHRTCRAHSVAVAASAVPAAPGPVQTLAASGPAGAPAAHTTLVVLAAHTTLVVLAAHTTLVALASFVAIVAGAGSPAVASAADPCPTNGPSPWPGGVDLHAACLAGQLSASYTKQESAFDPLTILAWVLLVSFVVALALDLGWQIVRRRAARRLAPVAPAEVWFCPGCRSFNHADAARCYRCRAARPEDAFMLDASAPPDWKQRFGRPFDRDD